MTNIDRFRISRLESNPIGNGPWDDLSWTKLSEHPVMSFRNIRTRAIKAEIASLTEEFQNIQARAGNILHVGSGAGTRIYLPKFIHPNVTSMDLSKPLLSVDKAPKKVVANAEENYPFNDECFDMVVGFFLNRYLNDQKPFFEQVSRVLKRNGKFVFIDHQVLNNLEERSEFIPNDIDRMKIIRGNFETETKVLWGGTINSFLSKEVGDFVYTQGPLYAYKGLKTS